LTLERIAERMGMADRGLTLLSSIALFLVVAFFDASRDLERSTLIHLFRARLGDLIRPRETMAMWGAVGKNTLNMGNVLCLTGRQMVRALLPYAEAIVASPPYRARSRHR
jgi:hypothetical protein